MFVEIQSILRLDEKSLCGKRIHLQEGQHLLADFMVHHFLSLASKSGKKIYLVALEHTIGHYHSVSIKLGGNIIKKKETGELIFFDGLRAISNQYLASSHDGDELINLENLLMNIKEEMSNGGIILFDRMTSLLGLGFSLSTVIKFVTNLQALANETQCTLVILTTANPEPNAQEFAKDSDACQLAAFLCHTSHLQVMLQPLPTGKSSNVTGNLIFDWKTLTTSHSGNYQFRVEEKDVKVFAPGTSKAVL